MHSNFLYILLQVSTNIFYSLHTKCNILTYLKGHLPEPTLPGMERKAPSSATEAAKSIVLSLALETAEIIPASTSESNNWGILSGWVTPGKKKSF